MVCKFFERKNTRLIKNNGNELTKEKKKRKLKRKVLDVVKDDLKASGLKEEHAMN